MRTTIVVLTVTALLVITSCVAGATEAARTFDIEVEKAMLESSVQQLADAWVIQDAEENDRFISPQVTCFFALAEFRGTVGREAWHVPVTEGTSLVVKQLKWMIAPGLAVSTYREIQRFPGVPEREFLVTLVWQKRDGQWTVVHIHQSEIGP